MRETKDLRVGYTYIASDGETLKTLKGLWNVDSVKWAQSTETIECDAFHHTRVAVSIEGVTG